jgi:hypothetical protein
MKVTEMTERDAIEHFGQRGPEIVKLSRELVARGQTSYVPRGMELGKSLALKDRYGANGVAVYLLMNAWREVPWRVNEGKPSNKDSEVVRLSSWSELAGQEDSQTWTNALKIAGIQTTDRRLYRVWQDAGAIGFEIGSHNAKLLASASCGELAQLSSENEPHFFIDMMPWIIKGYWVCGWDDENNRLKVL